MPSHEHFDRFFLLAAVGLGLVLAGGMNVAFGGRHGRRVGLRAVVSVAVCGAMAAAVYSLTRAELAVRTGGVLGGVLLATALFSSERFHRQLAAVVAVVRRPTARWGLLSVGGLALLVASVIGFDRAETALIERDTLDLETTLGRHPGVPTDRARAVTDRGTRVVLKELPEPRDTAVLTGPEEKLLHSSKLDEQVIRHGPPSDASNCHGWVFTGGKFLLSPDDVELILKDNGYTETHEPQTGDVAIYRQVGVIAHSAEVWSASEGKPVMVVGKWGTLGVFRHDADKSLYGTDITFYRSARSGHLLVGVGGTSPNPNVVAPAVSE